ncbi:CsbD family protein [Rhodobacteraceae bacterium NNCM2]|nr:CsbD family protein [Coraliihabitans acroporae]
MDWNIIEGKWTQLQGQAREQWGKLTDDELAEINGNQEQLIGKIQERYGYARDEAERRVNDWAEQVRNAA